MKPKIDFGEPLLKGRTLTEIKTGETDKVVDLLLQEWIESNMDPKDAAIARSIVKKWGKTFLN